MDEDESALSVGTESVAHLILVAERDGVANYLQDKHGDGKALRAPRAKDLQMESAAYFSWLDGRTAMIWGSFKATDPARIP